MVFHGCTNVIVFPINTGGGSISSNLYNYSKFKPTKVG